MTGILLLRCFQVSRVGIRFFLSHFQGQLRQEVPVVWSENRMNTRGLPEDVAVALSAQRSVLTLNLAARVDFIFMKLFPHMLLMYNFWCWLFQLKNQKSEEDAGWEKKQSHRRSATSRKRTPFFWALPLPNIVVSFLNWKPKVQSES